MLYKEKIELLTNTKLILLDKLSSNKSLQCKQTNSELTNNSPQQNNTSPFGQKSAVTVEQNRQSRNEKLSYEKLYAENEKRKNTISTVNAILNENPNLKHQFILAKNQYELKQNGDIAKTASNENSQKLPPKNKHSRH